MDGIDVMSVEVEDKGQLYCLLWTGGGTMVNRHESGIMLCRSSNKSLGDPCLIVTGFWKTLRMAFFVKIEFDVSLISPTLELTHLQV